MPDLYCPECGKERFERKLTMRIKDGSAYYLEGECECGTQMKLKNPKKGIARLARMDNHGQSY